MNKFIIFVFILFLSNIISGQFSASIYDADTYKSIPYVNIWVANGAAGTSADETGKFHFGNVAIDSLIFTAVGYKREVLALKNIGDSIFLKPAITQLPEVKIQGYKKTILKIGKAVNSDIEYCVGNDYAIRKLARYFPFKSEYIKTPYIKTIRVKTYSFLDNTIENIQFYSVAESCEPNALLYGDNILMTVKKGTHTTEVDVSDLNIRFPENGIYVGFENLLLEENRLELEYRLDNSFEIKKVSIYEPRIKVYEDVGKTNFTYSYNGKEWIKNPYNNTISLEIILSN